MSERPVAAADARSVRRRHHPSTGAEPLRHRPLLILAALSSNVLRGCGGSAYDGAATSSDGCGAPVYGYAQVQGQAWYADGAPVADKTATVACGGPVGTYSDRTDSEGGFAMILMYAVFDTLLHPFPPA